MFQLTSLLHLLEPITALAARLYVVSSEVFTISALLFGLNILANMVEKIYDFGVAFGTFYREYCHQFVKWASLRLIALVILASDLTWLGAKSIYNNRSEILSTLNDWRNNVGDLFAYHSPSYAKA